jgi:hypothetical protein
LKLIGFGIWNGREGRHLTFPAKPFVVNGERRSYALLRPVSDHEAQEVLRRQIMEKFEEFERNAAALIGAPLMADVTSLRQE